MTRISLFLAAYLSIGASLAATGFYLDVSAGWLGAFGLLVWALSIRKHWVRVENNSETEPSPPARILWVQCASFSLLLGHLILALFLTGDDLRLGNNNALAIDSWIMIGAALATSFIFRRDRNIQDERDREISAGGVSASYQTFIVLGVGFSLFLAFAPLNYRSEFTHFVTGNVLIALILAAHLAQLISRLSAYARDGALSLLEEDVG